MKDALKKKGMFVKKLSNQGEFFRKRWENEFASALSASQKRKFIWTNFYGMHLAMKSSLAYKENKRFKRLSTKLRTTVICCLRMMNESLRLSKCKHLTTADLSENTNMYLEDLYVVDKDFTWTYVIIHESSCGPYFYRT